MYLLVAAFCPRTEEQNALEHAELAELEEERTVTADALYERAVIAQREDTLDFYERAKAAGFPVDDELTIARSAIGKPISKANA